jgi:RNA polymerase primary sigma factor
MIDSKGEYSRDRCKNLDEVVENIDNSVDINKVKGDIEYYLASIGFIPVLTREEEVELGKKLEESYNNHKEYRNKAKIALKKYNESGRMNGVYFNDYNDSQKKARIALNQNKALKKYLWEKNLKLITNIAKNYRGKGMDFIDLIGEGNLGIARAIEKWDYKRGFKFSTYATWWIRQAVKRSLDDLSRTIRVPTHMVEKYCKIRKIYAEYMAKYNRKPDVEYVAKRLKLSKDWLMNLFKRMKNPISLDAPLNEHTDTEYREIYDDEKANDPVEQVNETLLNEKIKKILNTLTYKEKMIIEMRYGIGYDHSYTLEEVGRIVGVTRERIRQIEVKAMRKLQHPSRSRLLEKEIKNN